MHFMSTQKNTDESLINEWFAVNSAVWCHRMSASITTATCEKNQLLSTNKCGDLRCNGCGGLLNQDHAISEHRIFPDNTPASGLSTLDEIIDDLYENPLPGDYFDDVVVELDDEQLLALFPELVEPEDEEAEHPRFAEHKTEMPRYPVYRGRCKKCGGYVENTRERKDDHVFRCLACGWRTSPEYERNRAIHAAGGVM